MTRNKGLGRGLDALLGASRASFAATGETPVDQIIHLPLQQLCGGRYQPRRAFDAQALSKLADSIRAHGVLQPVVVRPLANAPAGGPAYEIIAGERRWRASQQAGLTEIPALVREVDEPTALALALIENIQRADLNPLEEAEALARLIGEFGLTHQQVAEAIGRSRTAVTNLLRLMELTPEVKQLLERAELEMGHARALLGLKDLQQTQAARQVVAAGLSVRETERLVRRCQQDETGLSDPPAPTPPDPDISRLQGDLTDRLGAEVRIQHGQRGAGRVVIAYRSLDELDGILAHIR